MDNPTDKPRQGALIADLGRGVTLREEAEGNNAWVLGHLRQGDQVERDAATQWQKETGAREAEPLKVAFVWAGEDLVGKWGSYQANGTTLLDDVRVWSWETTHEADKHWRVFVRMTLPVWQTIWLLEDVHVTRALLMPWAGYEKTLRWQARYFRQKELGRVLVGDRIHIIYELYRHGVGEGRRHGH